MARLLLILALLAISFPSVAQIRSGGASNDLLAFGESLRCDEPLCNDGNNSLKGHSCETDAGGKPCVPTIIPAVKTLVLFAWGDSIGASSVPSAFVPTNVANIHNFSIYDGALYADLDPLIGQTQTTLGAGSMSPRLADNLISSGSFARVILVPTNVGGSASGHWGVGGVLYNKVLVRTIPIKRKSHAARASSRGN